MGERAEIAHQLEFDEWDFTKSKGVRLGTMYVVCGLGAKYTLRSP